MYVCVCGGMCVGVCGYGYVCDLHSAVKVVLHTCVWGGVYVYVGVGVRV